MIFILTASILGIVTGLFLSYIAFEELEELKIVLVNSKLIVLLILSLGMIYNSLSLAIISLIPLTIGFVILVSIEAMNDYFKRDIRYELIYYSIIFTTYLIIKNKSLINSQMLLVLTLIYGVFLGSILHLKFLHQIDKQDILVRKTK